MINEQFLTKYCLDEIAKADKELDHKTHLRFRGHKEAFEEILTIIKDEVQYEPNQAK